MMTKLVPVSLLALACCLGGCAATTTPTTGTPVARAAAEAIIPVRVTGIVHGERFDFECTTLHSAKNAESTLIYTAEGDIFVSCHNANLGISANTTIKRPTVGVQSDGRVAITIDKPADSHPDIITTESGSSNSAGYVSVSEWDAPTQHLRGTSAMWWSRFGGEKGEVKIEYNVSRQTYSL
jgi:hypothetical protein